MGLGRRLLVTGAGGQLGKALANLVPDGVMLDRHALDVTDSDAVRSSIVAYDPEVIIHAAAFTNVDAAEADVVAAKAVNVEGTRSVAEAAHDANAFLVYLSTDYVFSGDRNLAYREDDETGPASVYGATKLRGENVVSGNERHLIVRTSWVYGEGRNFIQSIFQLAELAEELSVVDDQWGLPTSALDLAKGLMALIERKALGIYHLAGAGKPTSWADLAAMVIRASGGQTKIRRVSTEEYATEHTGYLARRPRYSVLDCSKAAGIGVNMRDWPTAVEEFVRSLTQ